MNRTLLIFVSLGVAIIVIAGAVLFRPDIQKENRPRETSGELVVHGFDDVHEHASLRVYIENEPLSFSESRFAEQSENVHFHDDSSTIIHKHARGVSLPYFFETLGMNLTGTCLTLVTKESYCTQEGKTLDIYVNRLRINDVLLRYEISEGDKILINYGEPESDFSLSLKFNSVPEIPPDL